MLELTFEEIVSDHETLFKRLGTISEDLNAIHQEIKTVGINRRLAMAMESYASGVVTSRVSLESFTDYYSQTNVNLSMEAWAAIKAGIFKAALFGLIAAILGILAYGIRWLREWFNGRRAKKLLQQARGESRIVSAVVGFINSLSPDQQTALNDDPNTQVAASAFRDTITEFLYDLATKKYRDIAEGILLDSRVTVVSFFNEHLTNNLDAVWKLAKELRDHPGLPMLSQQHPVVLQKVTDVCETILQDVDLSQKVRFSGPLQPPHGVLIGEHLDNLLTEIDDALATPRALEPDTYIDTFSYRIVLDNAIKRTLDLNPTAANRTLTNAESKIKGVRSDVIVAMAGRANDITELLMEAIDGINVQVGIISKALQIINRMFVTVDSSDKAFLTLLESLLRGAKDLGLDLSTPQAKTLLSAYKEFKE